MLDKRAGVSSAKALSEAKRALSRAGVPIRKIGHAGTLDPMATGVLVCLLNGATRLAAHATAGLKRYSGEILFGRTTSTDDIEGEVLEECAALPDWGNLPELVSRFLGTIQQVPPRVSALKVNGTRSYELARRGSLHELPAREVTVSSFEVHPIDERRAVFSVTCSSGTYVRSLARDLGVLLGVGGCLAALRREMSAPFDVSIAHPVDALGPGCVLSWDALLPEAAHLSVPQRTAQLLLGGDQRALLELVPEMSSWGAEERLVVYRAAETNLPLGLLRWVAGVLSFVANIESTDSLQG